MNAYGQTTAERSPSAPPKPLDVERVRRDFPILSRTVRDRPLVYLDSAASAQKPRAVIDALSAVYEREYANVHRGIHYLSQKTTEAYEGAREKTRRFINAPAREEIIFVRGTTEAINLVASSYGRTKIGDGDEILITAMEHHSNIVPWQALSEQTGARLRVAPVNDRGEIVLAEFEKLIGPRTRMVAIAHVSNALGTINPVRKMIEMAHDRGAAVLLDGAQATPHMRVDVQELGCDFYAFSGHKVYGPSGIGVLYGRRELLEAMPPYQFGGEMIASVSFEKTTYNELPHKFEAGTPNIAGAIGLGAAIDYLQSIGLDAVEAHEKDLLAYAVDRLSGFSGLRFIGEPRERTAVVSFLLGNVHAHDIGTIVDREGVAIRTGHHCAQPLIERLGVAATARASFGVYNTKSDVDALVAALGKVNEVFG